MDCKINCKGESDEKWKHLSKGHTLLLLEESIEVIQKKKKKYMKKLDFFPWSFWLQDSSKT